MIEPPWQAIKEWIPDDEPDLDWFNRPGIPMSLTQTGSTKAKHGRHPKSIWTTVASWFSNTPDKQEAQPPKNRRQKNSWQSGPQGYACDK